MAKKTYAWTPSADLVWSGDLPDDFRATADNIVKLTMTDEMWGELQSCVHAYAWLLSHERQAATFSEQKKVIEAAIAASSAYLAALGKLDLPEYGKALSHVVADQWEKDNMREAEHERMQGRAFDHLAGVFGSLGVDEGPARDLAGEVLGDWRGSGFIQAPWPVPDLLVEAHELHSAMIRTVHRLETDPDMAVAGGMPFVEFVGRLYEWDAKHRLNLSATKNKDGAKGAGTMVALVKAIQDIIPILIEDDGSESARQIKPVGIDDFSLASNIINAHRRYEQGRPPKPAKLGII